MLVLVSRIYRSSKEKLRIKLYTLFSYIEILYSYIKILKKYLFLITAFFKIWNYYYQRKWIYGYVYAIHDNPDIYFDSMKFDLERFTQENMKTRNSMMFFNF